MESTLYDDLIAAGIEVGNHESDLYFPMTNESAAILARHPLQKSNATTFTNQITKTRWYDVPFAFKPFWDNVSRVSARRAAVSMEVK